MATFTVLEFDVFLLKRQRFLFFILNSSCDRSEKREKICVTVFRNFGNYDSEILDR
jgi:hypothetical protein